MLCEIRMHMRKLHMFSLVPEAGCVTRRAPCTSDSPHVPPSLSFCLSLCLSLGMYLLFGCI